MISHTVRPNRWGFFSQDWLLPSLTLNIRRFGVFVSSDIGLRCVAKRSAESCLPRSSQTFCKSRDPLAVQELLPHSLEVGAVKTKKTSDDDKGHPD